MTTRALTNIWLALAIMFSGGETLLAGKNAKDIVKKVQEKYNKLQSLQAEFKQDFKWELAGQTQSVSGKVYVNQGNQYRIETDTQEIITDGSTVWTFSKKSEQVIIDRLEEGQEGQLPKDLLFKYAEDYQPVYIGEEEIDGHKTYVLNLIPKKEDALVKSMKIWVDSDDWYTRKIEQTDINDNVNTYLVTNIQENVKFEPSLFTFDVREEYEVVDLRQTQ